MGNTAHSRFVAEGTSINFTGDVIDHHTVHNSWALSCYGGFLIRNYFTNTVAIDAPVHNHRSPSSGTRYPYLNTYSLFEIANKAVHASNFVLDLYNHPHLLQTAVPVHHFISRHKRF